MFRQLPYEFVLRCAPRDTTTIILRTTGEEVQPRWALENRNALPPERFSSLVCVGLVALPVVTQSPNGVLNGLVVDPPGA